MRIAVIPARGGSKRIPRKNVKEFYGQPMIHWSLRAAQESGCFDRIVVSTDDDEIAAIARECGAEVPFMRPAELANDHCGTAPVIAHAIEVLCGSGAGAGAGAGAEITEACCIYATAPMIEPDDLQAGLAILQTTGADFAFSVTSYAFPIQRALRLDGDGRTSMFEAQHEQTRSQDLPEAYHDAGQFYWGTAEAWAAAGAGTRSIMSGDSAAVVLPRHRVQDIDTPEDWVRAEAMMAALQAAAPARPSAGG